MSGYPLTRPSAAHLLVWASIGVDETTAAEAPRLREYLRAKKHQMQAASAVCMVFAVDDTIAPAMVIYENNPPGPNAELDRVVTNSNLRPVTRTVDRHPGSRRR